MLDVLLSTCLAAAVPQGRMPAAEAVAVRGDAELSPAEAFESARRRAEDHVRERWQQRADRTWAERPFWVPDVVASHAMGRCLDDLALERSMVLVDRQDHERTHEFGNSYQTTLWVAEEPNSILQREHLLRKRLRELERVTAIKYGGIAASWVLLGVLLGWIDRLSRGYMTGRLRLLGLLAAAAIPTVTFLV